jgi:hypothetical protein
MRSACEPNAIPCSVASSRTDIRQPANSDRAQTRIPGLGLACAGRSAPGRTGCNGLRPRSATRPSGCLTGKLLRRLGALLASCLPLVADHDMSGPPCRSYRSVIAGCRARPVPFADAVTACCRKIRQATKPFLRCQSFLTQSRRNPIMHSIIYVVGLIVVIMAVLSFFGLR